MAPYTPSASQLVAMNTVGGGCARGYDTTTPDFGNDGVGARTTMANVGNYSLHLACQKRFDVHSPRVHFGSGKLAVVMRK